MHFFTISFFFKKITILISFFKETVLGSTLHEITSKELVELFSSFTVKCPDDSLFKSFACKILKQDLLQEYEAAIQSLSGGVMLTKSIDWRKNISTFAEVWVCEVNVVCDRKLQIIEKVIQLFD